MKLTNEERTTLEEFTRWQETQPLAKTLGDHGWLRVDRDAAKLLDDVASITLKLLAE